MICIFKDSFALCICRFPAVINELHIKRLFTNHEPPQSSLNRLKRFGEQSTVRCRRAAFQWEYLRNKLLTGGVWSGSLELPQVLPSCQSPESPGPRSPAPPCMRTGTRPRCEAPRCQDAPSPRTTGHGNCQHTSLKCEQTKSSHEASTYTR